MSGTSMDGVDLSLVKTDEKLKDKKNFFTNIYQRLKKLLLKLTSIKQH